MGTNWRARATGLLAAAALAVPLAVAAPSGIAEADVPSGFELVDYPTGIDNGKLTDFIFTPDNKGYYALGKNGVVTWTSINGGASKVIARLDALDKDDLGAVSIDLGHKYGQPGVAPSLWIVRIKPDGRYARGEGVLSEFPVNLDASGNPNGLGAERRVVSFENRQITHGMDSVVVDNDGSIWLSIGDGAGFMTMDPLALDAQKDESPYGRVIHIDRNGNAIPSNPKYNAGSPRSWTSRTYAKGFRNPFRMRLHPTLGLPILGDVGWNTTEEHNVIRPGSNYGWPCWEGSAPTKEYSNLAGCAGVPNTTPIFEYSRSSGMGQSAMGGVIYQGAPDGKSGYPDPYKGTYFFADYIARRIYTMRMNDTATGLTQQPDPKGWAFDGSRGTIGVPVALRYAANGDIAYSDIVGAHIRRISYVASNRAPVAIAEYRTVNPATREVAFSLKASDPDNDRLSYRWNFGDGGTSTEQNPKRTYAGSGPYDASVTVTDGRGGSTTAKLQVYPTNGTPTLALTTPGPDKTFAANEQIRLSAKATDPEDGELTNIEWTSVREDCRGDFACTKTAGPSATGAEFTAPFEVEGDKSTYTITARAKDARGATVSRTYVAKPRLRNLTVTNNAGVPVSVNGVEGSVRQITVGSSVGLAAPRSAEGMTFASWSDGVTLSARTITMPDSDLSLQVRYTSRIAERYASDAAVRATLGAPVGPETGDANGREQVYERGRMYFSPKEGVHELHGVILATYLREGGMARLGVPSSDEIATPDGKGKMNTLAGTPANPNPVIYYRIDRGANLVMGSIQAQYQAMNATRGVHGYPRNSERSTPDGRARYNDFENGGIYWSGTTGARSVYGAIYGTWANYRWEAGHLRLPTTSEMGTPNGKGRYNHFEGGSIYWSPASGSHEIRGSIRDKWSRMGWETSVLGFPTTDELGTPDRVGRFNHFEGGSIYWSPRTGAYEVHGLIRDEWSRRGWERSSLGYPTSDEFAVPGGRRSNFQRGYIEWVNGRINVVVR